MVAMTAPKLVTLFGRIIGQAATLDGAKQLAKQHGADIGSIHPHNGRDWIIQSPGEFRVEAARRDAMAEAEE